MMPLLHTLIGCSLIVLFYLSLLGLLEWLDKRDKKKTKAKWQEMKMSERRKLVHQLTKTENLN